MKKQANKETNTQQLHQELENLLREQFKLRMQKSSGENMKPHLFVKVRKSIARIKTQLHAIKLNERVKAL